MFAKNFNCTSRCTDQIAFIKAVKKKAYTFVSDIDLSTDLLFYGLFALSRKCPAPGGMFANSIRACAHIHGHAHDCRHAHARGYYHGHKKYIIGNAHG